MQRLELDSARASSGPTVVFDGAEPRTVLLTLDAGEEVPRHDHPGRTVVCSLRSGRLRFESDEESVELESGDVLRVEGDREVSLVAEADSEALIVVPRTD